MAMLGPFEPAPRLAVGVSGGADSMALALLADAWARERGGTILALIVDHGLRTESKAEAAEAAGDLRRGALRLGRWPSRASPGVRPWRNARGRHGSVLWPRPAPEAVFCICCSGTIRVIRQRP